MTKKHHSRGGSTIARLANCGASLALSQGLPEQYSDYAAEGTRAHEIAAAFLVGGEDEMDVDAPDDMVEAVQEYVSHILTLEEQWLDAPGVQMIERAVEIKLESSRFEDCGGTVDYLLIVKKDDVTYCFIRDYKHGQGIAVSAENNQQLIFYMAMAREHYQLKGAKYMGGIIQPRTGGETVKLTELITDDELDDMEEVIEKTYDEEHQQRYAHGEWCTFCPAAQECPHLYEIAIKAATEDFPIIEEAAKEGVDKAMDAGKLTAARLANLMDVEKPLKALFARVHEVALLAIQEGYDVPGYKAVQSLGNRTWADQDDVIVKRLRGRGLKVADFQEKRLISPPQVEKRVGDKDEAARVLKGLVIRPERGLSVVKTSDRRAPVEFVSAQEEVAFEDLGADIEEMFK